VAPDKVQCVPVALPIRYRSADEDSIRWCGFPFRSGDIVISARSRSGTTWTQMICALLVFQTSELPAPLGQLSPWLDWLVAPRDEVFARLSAQRHRRIIKTHTPLDGIPWDTRATYVVVARNPLDAAVSMYHHYDNIDRERYCQLTGQTNGDKPRRPPVGEWLLSWIDADEEPRTQLDSLPGMMYHLAGAWALRAESNVVLVHYDDLATDLEGEMRRLAARLEIDISDHLWPALVESATFAGMRARSAQLAPGPAGMFKNSEAFFRRGFSGAGRDLLSDRELAHYRARAEQLAPPDLVAWLHREHAPGASITRPRAPVPQDWYLGNRQPNGQAGRPNHLSGHDADNTEERTADHDGTL
jgi:aryl sulfotransferase